MEYITEIIIALIALFGTLAGSFLSHRKSTALVVYRLEQLENKVNEHNQVIERTYELEKSKALFEERVRHLEHFHE